MLTLNTVGDFTWNYGSKFHIETEEGNFEWSDPNYGGDNTIKPASPYTQWLDENNLEYGRSKGCRIISEYCGPNVVIVQ